MFEIMCLSIKISNRSNDCILQDLDELWHSQPPFRYGFVSSATTVCLQVNRIPALGFRTKTPVKWNRQTVRFPCFMFSIGCTIQWKEYVVVAVILHRGENPRPLRECVEDRSGTVFDRRWLHPCGMCS